MTLSVTSPSADRNDDRVARVGIALQRTAYFEAVELGHHHIEQDEIGMHPARNVERRAAVLRREQAITAPLERAHDQSQIHRAVVDDRIVALVVCKGGLPGGRGITLAIGRKAPSKAHGCCSSDSANRSNAS